MNLNREQKRSMKRMGAVNDQGAPIRQPRPAVVAKATKERVGPFQYNRVWLNTLVPDRITRPSTQLRVSAFASLHLCIFASLR